MNRGALTALRAAAIVVVATGLNDVIAGALPRYEPLYAYLAAIAVVVLLDGVLLGALAAVLALGFYALLFVPRAELPARLLIPVAAAIATILAFGAVRAVIRSRRRPPTVELFAAPPTPLLPPAPHLPADSTEVLDAIEEMRGELRSAVVELSAARNREAILERTFVEARESLVERLRIATEEGRAQEADFRRQLDAERAAFEAAKSEALSLAAEGQTRTARLQQTESALGEARHRVTSLSAEKEQLHTLIHAERQRTSTLQATLEGKIAAITEDARALRAGLEARIATLSAEAESARAALEAERAGAIKLSADVAQERERSTQALAEKAREHVTVEALRAEIEKLQRMLTAERGALASRVAELDALRAELTDLKSAADAARIEAARDRESALQALRETQNAESAALKAELEKERADLETVRIALADAEAAREKAQTDRETSVQTLRGTLEAELIPLRNQLGDAQAALADVRAERTALKDKLETIQRELAQTRETSERDIASLQELARLRASQEEETRQALEQELADVKAQARAAADELDTERGEAIARATDAATLRRELDLERGRAEGERILRERAELDLAATRADVKLLESRLSELDSMRSSTETELRALLEALKAEQATERAEFDQKLSTIVTHLAHDHEADLGKAVLEREEARAEARSAATKLSKLQQRVDGDRQAVLARLREADERHKHAIADANQLLAETRAAAQQEIERLQLRIAELEQQHPPLPARASKGRILIAHPDAEMRATARVSLEKAGYEVVMAADGLEALRTANAEHPDVVIADTIMPRMNGRELCQLLKSQKKTAGIRVILLTRSTDDLPKSDLPPDLLLRKPVPLETLRLSLEQLVRVET